MFNNKDSEVLACAVVFTVASTGRVVPRFGLVVVQVRPLAGGLPQHQCGEFHIRRPFTSWNLAVGVVCRPVNGSDAKGAGQASR